MICNAKVRGEIWERGDATATQHLNVLRALEDLNNSLEKTPRWGSDDL